jgi:hypothetical protein
MVITRPVTNVLWQHGKQVILLNMGNMKVQTLREHLLSRGLDPEKYSVVINEVERVATFPLFTLTGQMVGYQTYRPEGVKNTSEGRKLGLTPRELKYFTHVTCDKSKQQYSVAVFGMENFDWRKSTLYVVEGVFDAVKLHSLGLNAVAVLCNNPKPLRGFFKALGMRIVGVLDNDPAGLALSKTCDEYFVCPPNRDPGDMTTNELKELLKL